MARPVIRELGIGAHLGGEDGFSYGLLHGRDECRAIQLQASARDIWRKASRARCRRWKR